MDGITSGDMDDATRGAIGVIARGVTGGDMDGVIGDIAHGFT
jgi:hypothetical protein